MKSIALRGFSQEDPSEALSSICPNPNLDLEAAVWHIFRSFPLPLECGSLLQERNESERIEKARTHLRERATNDGYGDSLLTQPEPLPTMYPPLTWREASSSLSTLPDASSFPIRVSTSSVCYSTPRSNHLDSLAVAFGRCHIFRLGVVSSSASIFLSRSGATF